VWDHEKVKFFVRRLLEKIGNSKNVPEYDFILFDCPPSFSLLSYSVLSCCDLVLIPINPDFFAAKGLNLLLSTLRARIEPMPVPKIGVFIIGQSDRVALAQSASATKHSGILTTPNLCLGRSLSPTA
jgi:cellulose biosynthesis protein BcsQ